MLSEPYDFTDYDLNEYKNDFEDNIHEYEEGGLCKLNNGDKIKKYIVNKILGEGSYSSVWSVKHNDKLYAMKINKANKSDEEVGHNEIKILNKLRNSSYVIRLEESFYI